MVPHRGAVSKLRQMLACQCPLAYCDGCLAFHLRVSLADAKATALAVAKEPGYRRERRDCYGCGSVVELTRTRSRKLLP